VQREHLKPNFSGKRGKFYHWQRCPKENQSLGSLARKVNPCSQEKENDELEVASVEIGRVGDLVNSIVGKRAKKVPRKWGKIEGVYSRRIELNSS